MTHKKWMAGTERQNHPLQKIVGTQPLGLSFIGKVRPLHRGSVSAAVLLLTSLLWRDYFGLYWFVFCVWHREQQPKLHRTNYMLYNGNSSWIFCNYKLHPLPSRAQSQQMIEWMSLPCWGTGDMTLHLWPDLNPKCNSTMPTSWLRQVDTQFMQSLLQFSLTRPPFVLAEYAWLSLLHQ